MSVLIVLRIVLRLTALAIVATWLVAALPGAQLSEAGPAALILAIVLAPLVALIVHEAGHLGAGTVAGMRPVLMIAGPLNLYWRSGHFWPRLRAGPLVPGGFTLCVPGSGRTVRGQMLAMVAGGPAASLLLGLAALPAAAGTDGALRYAVVLMGLVSGAVFVMTALPSARRGMANDGAKFRILMENGDRARNLTATLALLAAAHRGMPPAKWPRAGLEALTTGPDTAERVAGLHYVYWMALDAGETDRAERLLTTLQEMVEGMSEVIAAPVAFEAAAFHLFVRGEPETARALSQGRKMPVFEDQYLEPLVQAGLALAAGERGQAADLAARARVQLRKALYPAIAAVHARWLERLETEIESGSPEAAA